MNTNKENIFQDYDSNEGYGAFMCAVVTISLVTAFVAGALLYCLIDSIIK